MSMALFFTAMLFADAVRRDKVLLPLEVQEDIRNKFMGGATCEFYS